jgi:hypothetical protein
MLKSLVCRKTDSETVKRLGLLRSSVSLLCRLFVVCCVVFDGLEPCNAVMAGVPGIFLLVVWRVAVP